MICRMASALPKGYRVIFAVPAVEDYLALRERAGLSPKTYEQAVAALQGSWVACHITYEPTGQTVGMGRVLGDGGWYLHVVDMAVLPEHQRRGLGDAMLGSLLERIRGPGAPRGLRQPPRRPTGSPPLRPPRITDTAPHSIGMALRLTLGSLPGQRRCASR